MEQKIEKVQVLEYKYLPQKQTYGSDAYDMYSQEDYVLKVGERKLFKSGLRLNIPEQIYCTVHSRSGLAYKHGVLAFHGLIDNSYNQDIGVILFNLGQQDFEVKKGDRIAQLLFHKAVNTQFYQGDQCIENNNNQKREGGFGSTG